MDQTARLELETIKLETIKLERHQAAPNGIKIERHTMTTGHGGPRRAATSRSAATVAAHGAKCLGSLGQNCGIYPIHGKRTVGPPMVPMGEVSVIPHRCCTEIWNL